MPQLLVFAVCEVSTVDQENGGTSLINLFTGINLTRKEVESRVQEAESENEGSEEAIVGAPIRWSAVAMWRALPEDEGQVFEQKIEIIDPKGRSTGGAIGAFQLKVGKSQVNRSAGDSLPVGESGECIIRLSLRKVADIEDFKQIADWIISVNHLDDDPTL
jgi:hypothetical protein